MARQKVKLAFIVNDAARKATYMKRSKNILKKANELALYAELKHVLYYMVLISQNLRFGHPLGKSKMWYRNSGQNLNLSKL
jgi:hypothetical protein